MKLKTSLLVLFCTIIAIHEIKASTLKSNDSIPNQSEAAKVWRNFKFIPGEKVIFYDDLKFEEVGEFPSKWDVLEGGGSAEIALLNKEKVIIPTADYYNRITPLFNKKNYLSDEFTIEFDVFVDQLDNINKIVEYTCSLKENSFNMGISELTFTFRGNTLEGRVKEGLKSFEFETISCGELNSWHHISISYYKKKLKVYYDQHRIVNLPNFKIIPKKFALDITPDNFKGAIKNIRIAHGGGKMYKRIMSEGKYVTNGILFDSGKVTIKTQSMGIINKMVTVLNEKPDWKLEIIGHTDSDGDEQSNLKLSKKRAQAIKNVMVSLGISKDRLSVIGKGESEPLNGNNNDIEKANNRRVEFIKK